MAIEPIESTNTPNEGREIINDNFVDLEGRLNEVEIGVDAFTTTTASFVQPAISGTVSVTVDNTLWMVVGQPVYMATGGHYTVSSITDPVTVVLANLGYTGNAAPAATVASGKKVSPSGPAGVDGASDAADVTFTPAGTIAATDVQAAIEEVAAEGGSSTVAPVTITTNTTADTTKHTYLVNAASGAVTLTLPTAVGRAGKEYVVKKIDSSSNLVTVDGDGSETIDGVASVSTDLQWDSVTVESDGTNWQTTSPFTGSGGGGSSSSWRDQTGAGAIFAAYGEGNPVEQATSLSHTATTITATQVGTTSARVVKFRIPKTLVVSIVRVFVQSSNSGKFDLGIYRVSDNVRMWAYRNSEGATSFTANWNDLTINTPFTLVADTDYWFAISAITTEATARFLTRPSPSNTALWDQSGSVMIGEGLGFPEYSQFSVTTGAMPNTMTTPPSTISSWVGSLPYAFLEGTAS